MYNLVHTKKPDPEIYPGPGFLYSILLAFALCSAGSVLIIEIKRKMCSALADIHLMVDATSMLLYLV